MSEHLEQVRLVAWLRKTYPQHRVYAIPNGGKRAKAEALRLKNEGVLKGVHDLHMPSIRLWIEMKENEKKKASKEQVEWGEYVESFGDHWFVGYGFEDAKSKFLEFMSKKGD